MRNTVKKSRTLWRITPIDSTAVTFEDMNAYRDELRAAGFNQNENDTMPGSTDTIVWNAANSSGWLVRMNYSEGQSAASIQIQKP